MLETLAKMSQHLEGMSPPRKRSARHQQKATEQDDESCSISVDTRSHRQDDESLFTTTHSQTSSHTTERGTFSDIQDISAIHPTSNDPDCTMHSTHTWSQDFLNQS
jgi:hypothetical protein